MQQKDKTTFRTPLKDSVTSKSKGEKNECSHINAEVFNCNESQQREQIKRECFHETTNKW